MVSVTIEEIQRDPSKYLRQVEAGETFIILQANQPIAVLSPAGTNTEIEPTSSVDQQPRPFGLCAGEFIVPEDFDAPLPEEILSAFEGQ